ncbi:uncharacterized protein LOC124654668 [Lolium rigidum]|uniref:uncharacterized protein LOC124654668 n=1 Tax=Lolium rigidum TaxID=89674 RepID=UPI001F5CF588|nr:uncharacterized protein LOC124654668 [Lolium rigidum]
MSLAAPPAPPLPPPRLRAFRPSAAGQSRALSGRGRSLGSLGRAYYLFSGGGGWKQESALGLSMEGFELCGMETETRQQRARRGGPCPAARGGGGRSGGGGGGGGGGWFRWFSSGGFWDAAKQTVLTILGIIAAFFLIANFNVLVAAAVNPLLLVLRQIRRAITFAAYCVSRGMAAPGSRPKSTPIASSELAAMPVKGSAELSAKERVIRKWGSD